MNYATLAELRTFLGLGIEAPDPTGYIAKLRIASGLVADAIEGARYPTDDAGMPTTAADIIATRDATCTQVEAWLGSGIDPTKGTSQLKRGVKSKGALGVTVTYDDDASAADREALASGTSLTYNAWTILRRAGLITARVGSPRPVDVVYAQTPFDLTTGELG